MPVAAAPATSRHVSAAMVIARVKPFSIPVLGRRSIARNLDCN